MEHDIAYYTRQIKKLATENECAVCEQETIISIIDCCDRIEQRFSKMQGIIDAAIIMCENAAGILRR